MTELSVKSWNVLTVSLLLRMTLQHVRDQSLETLLEAFWNILPILYVQVQQQLSLWINFVQLRTSSLWAVIWYVRIRGPECKWSLLSLLCFPHYIPRRSCSSHINSGWSFLSWDFYLDIWSSHLPRTVLSFQFPWTIDLTNRGVDQTGSSVSIQPVHSDLRDVKFLSFFWHIFKWHILPSRKMTARKSLPNPTTMKSSTSQRMLMLMQSRSLIERYKPSSNL